MSQERCSTRRTWRAARAFTRRTLLKCGLAAGTLALGGCQTTSVGGRVRRLNVAVWPGFIPEGLKRDFAADTGIEVATSTYESNIELLTNVRSAEPGAFDLICPSVYRAPLWRHQNLLQPVDEKRIDTSRFLQPVMAQSREHWSWDGRLHHLPLLWGTEALAWRSDIWSPGAAGPSYGDLWLPEMKGKMQVRPYSMLTGVGLYLDRIGEVPSDRLRAGYRDPTEMERIWTAIIDFAIAHRFWINQFWDDEQTQRYGFTDAGCIIGQTWHDAMIDLKADGAPVSYRAPQEGALAWMDGLAIPAGARNLDEVYVFLDYIYRPQLAGRLSSATGFYTAPAGAVAFMTADDRSAYQQSLPGDALERLWFWPPTPEWYRRKRSTFLDRYLEAADNEPEPA